MPDKRLTEMDLLRLGSHNALYYIVENAQSRSVSGSGIAHYIDSGHYLTESPYFRTLSGNFRLTGNYSMEAMNGTGFFRNLVAGEKLTHTLRPIYVFSSILGGTTATVAGDYCAIVAGDSNKIGGNNAIIGAGYNNIASAYSFIGAGQNNNAFGTNAVIGGGISNLTSGFKAVVVGGQGNLASGTNTFVGAGQDNIARINGATVVGGAGNLAWNTYCFVGAGNANQARGQAATVVAGTTNIARDDGAFIGAGNENTTSGLYAVIVAGNQNKVVGDYTFIGAGNQNGASGSASMCVAGVNNRVSGINGLIVGGQQNEATGTAALVVGGFQNTGRGDYAMVVGGQQNQVGPLKSEYGLVVGGLRNSNTGSYSVVVGGNSNLSTSTGGFIGGGANNSINDNYGVVVGGSLNYASGYSFVGGGKTNTANGAYSVVVGGNANKALVGLSFVGGGTSNVASGGNAAIVCGASNELQGNNSFIGAGVTNRIIGSNGSAILAGVDNAITGGGHCTILAGQKNSIGVSTWGTVVGGYNNLCKGDYAIVAGQNSSALAHNSFAAGYKAVAQAADVGSFVFGDAINKTKSSVDANACFMWFQSGLRLSGTPLILDTNTNRKPTSASDTRGFQGQFEIDEDNGVWVRMGIAASANWKLLPFAAVGGGADPNNLTADLEDFSADGNFSFPGTSSNPQLVVFGSTNAEIVLPDIGTYIVEAVIHGHSYRVGGQFVHAYLYNTTDSNDYGHTWAGTNIVNPDSNQTFYLDQTIICKAKITTASTNNTVQIWSYLEPGGTPDTMLKGEGSMLSYLKISS